MATGINSGMLVNPQELRKSSTTQEGRLGTIAESNDGRKFRYVQNGATTMVSGRMMQAAPETTAHQNLAPAAAAIGDVSIDIKLGATAINANEYAEGWMVVTANAGEAEVYAISGHAAVDASGTIVLKLSDPIEVALTADSTVDLVRNPYKFTVITPTTRTSGVVGVALHAIGASEFGWVGTGGAQPVFAGGTLVVGTALVASTAVAGEVIAATNVGQDDETPKIGIALTGVTDSEFGVMLLNIN